MRILKNLSGEILIDESFPECKACIAKGQELVAQCPIDKQRARHTHLQLRTGEAFDCGKKLGFVNSKRMHEEMIKTTCDVLDALTSFKKSIQEKHDNDYKRLLHNIVSNNAHSIQEVFNLVSEDKLVRDTNHVNSLVNVISKDRVAAAKAFFRMFQAALAIKTEISTYERLYRQQGSLSIKKHGVHRVLMNSAYKFFPELNEVGIYLEVQPTADEVMVDYECVSIILYHLMDNARKYALPGRNIAVSFPKMGKHICILIDMVSLKIEDDEAGKIYRAGYTGKNAQRLERGGTGYGMSIVSELANRANHHFETRRNASPTVHILKDGVPYVRNQFVLQLPSAGTSH